MTDKIGISFADLLRMEKEVQKITGVYYDDSKLEVYAEILDSMDNKGRE